jgi:hypothetical protein
MAMLEPKASPESVLLALRYQAVCSRCTTTTYVCCGRSRSSTVIVISLSPSASVWDCQLAPCGTTAFSIVTVASGSAVGVRTIV